MTIVLVVILFCILSMLMGVIKGNNLSERIMSLGCLNNYLVVLLCILGSFAGRDSFIDIAYIYILLGFVLNLGLSKLNGKKYD